MRRNPESRVPVGFRHNKLMVTENTVFYRNKTRYVQVQCDCGNFSEVREYSILNREGGGMCRACAMVEAGRLRRLPDNDSAKNDYRNDYAQNAKTRGLEFSLNKEFFDQLIFQDCYYCGEPPSKIKKSRSSAITVNGVDRYDNSIGYTVDNCVAACWTCNNKKGAMNGNEFIEWATRVSEKFK